MEYFVIHQGDVKSRHATLEVAKKNAQRLAFNTNLTHIVVNGNSKLIYRAVPGRLKSPEFSLDKYIKKWYR
jgi:hypothetical protein